MKNRRVLYIFTTLVILVAVVLLSGVLFSVKTITSDLKGETRLLSSQDIDSYLAKYIGGNIFFLNEKDVTTDLEDKFPHMAVINIERIFPSTATIHYYERKEVFAIPLTSTSYAVVDAEGKILRKEEGNIHNLAKVVPIVDVENKIAVGEVGSFITSKELSMISNVYSAFNSLDNTSGFNFSTFVKSITYNGVNVILSLDRNGEIIFADALNSAPAKAAVVYAFYNGQTSADRVNLRMRVYYDLALAKNVVTTY